MSNRIERAPAAICGKNIALPADRMGCGGRIETHEEIYRCVDCGTPFHKGCLHRHCKNDLANERARATALALRVEALEAALRDARTALVKIDEAEDKRLDAVDWRARALAAESALARETARAEALEAALRDARTALIAVDEAEDARLAIRARGRDGSGS